MGRDFGQEVLRFATFDAKPTSRRSDFVAGGGLSAGRGGFDQRGESGGPVSFYKFSPRVAKMFPRRFRKVPCHKTLTGIFVSDWA